MTNIHERLAHVRGLIEKAAGKSRRPGSDVLVVAVTKGVAPTGVLEARRAGLTVFAENKVQEAAEKIPLMAPDSSWEWHFIGHLQSNKVKTALSLFSLIQSVDSVRLAGEIAKEFQADPADRLSAPRNILLQVNISGLAKRFGFEPEEVYGAVDAVNAMTGVRIAGLMGMAPHPASPEVKREAFKKLKNIFSVCKGLVKDKSQMKFLSMGMSDDFELAIEEGSNMIRIGRLLFA